MALTYQLIQAITSTTGQFDIQFTSIPQTYTDLIVRISGRSTNASAATDIGVYINSEGGSNYSWTRLRGDGATPISNRNSSGNSWAPGTSLNASTSTANTFSNIEIYLPNYTSTTHNKCGNMFSAMETNGSVAYINSVALLRSATAAITTVGLKTGDWTAGSTFYLYGIKTF